MLVIETFDCQVRDVEKILMLDTNLRVILVLLVRNMTFRIISLTNCVSCMISKIMTVTN